MLWYKYSCYQLLLIEIMVKVYSNDGDLNGGVIWGWLLRFLIFPDYVIPGRKRGEETRRGDPSMSLPFSEFKLLSSILKKKKIDKDFSTFSEISFIWRCQIFLWSIFCVIDLNNYCNYQILTAISCYLSDLLR